MRRTGLLNELHYKGLAKINGIYRPGNDSNWPWCAQCNIPVGKCEIAEAGPDPDKPKYVVLLARCDSRGHVGKNEDYFRAEWDVPIPLENLSKLVIRTARLFGSSHEDGNVSR